MDRILDGAEGGSRGERGLRGSSADDVDAVRSACDAAASLGVPVARKEKGNGSIK